MQTQATTWVDIKKLTEVYGIKVKHPIHGWINAGDNDGMFKFDTAKERDDMRSKLSNMTLPSGT